MTSLTAVEATRKRKVDRTRRPGASRGEHLGTVVSTSSKKKSTQDVLGFKRPIPFSSQLIGGMKRSCSGEEPDLGAAVGVRV